jgi:replicative DNA helicase
MAPMAIEQLAANEAEHPPHDLAAEAAVLGVMLHSGAHVPRLAAMLCRDDFYSGANGWVFDACVALHRAGQPVDVVTTMRWLADHGRFAQVGRGPLHEAITGAPSIGGAIRYATIVRAKARVRATINAARRIVAAGMAGQQEDAQYLAKSCHELAQAARLPQAEALVSNAETVKLILDNAQRANKLGSMVTGIPTGITRYDRLTLGLHSGQLTVVGARPGVGKTSLGLNWATNVAAAGPGVMFFSLEMSREELLTRQLSATARIDGTLFKTGALGSSQWAELAKAAAHVSKLPCWVDDRQGLTVADIANAALGAVDEAKAQSTALGCIIVDYLQKVRVPDSMRREQRYLQIKHVAEGLKQLARDTKLPVVALTQLRRLGKGERARRPNMEDLREGGDIESEADNIALLHEVDDEPRLREIIVEKARGGAQGTVTVAWRPELTLFEDLPEGQEWDRGGGGGGGSGAAPHYTEAHDAR